MYMTPSLWFNHFILKVGTQIEDTRCCSRLEVWAANVGPYPRLATARLEPELYGLNRHRRELLWFDSASRSACGKLWNFCRRQNLRYFHLELTCHHHIHPSPTLHAMNFAAYGMFNCSIIHRHTCGPKAAVFGRSFETAGNEGHPPTTCTVAGSTTRAVNTPPQFCYFTWTFQCSYSFGTPMNIRTKQTQHTQKATTLKGSGTHCGISLLTWPLQIDPVMLL